MENKPFMIAVNTETIAPIMVPHVLIQSLNGSLTKNFSLSATFNILDRYLIGLSLSSFSNKKINSDITALLSQLVSDKIFE